MEILSNLSRICQKHREQRFHGLKIRTYLIPPTKEERLTCYLIGLGGAAVVSFLVIALGSL